MTLRAGRGGVGLIDIGRGDRILGLDRGLMPELLRIRDDDPAKSTSALTVICIPSYGESSMMMEPLVVLGDAVEKSV